MIDQAAPSYVPLKCQTHYSILRSTVKVEALISHALKNNHHFLGICDLNTLSGFHEFYRLARANGIKPVIGATIDVFDAPPPGVNMQNGVNHRVSLLCKNYKGLLNLFKILNIGHTRTNGRDAQGRMKFQDRFFVTSREIFEYNENLICLLPNVSSFTHRLSVMKAGLWSDALLSDYIKTFGADRLYFEIWKDSIPREDEANLMLLELAKKRGVKITAATNCQYLSKDEHDKSFAAIYAFRSDLTFFDARIKVAGTGLFHFKSSDEMSKIFSHIKGALETTRDIAFECNVELPDAGPKMPRFAVPQGFSEDDYLAFQTREALSNLKPPNAGVYSERLEYELEIIKKLNFSGYFLIVADIIDHARAVEVPIGPGRGSACSSLVCYLLKITRIDPVKNKLMFERFMNPDRVKMPDIDVDFASSGRYKIIEYLSLKYGRNNVAQIITFNHFKHKALMGALLKILGTPEKTVKTMSLTLDTVLRENSSASFNEFFMRLPKEVKADPTLSKFCEIAAPLLNNIRQTSIHAGGLIVSPLPLDHNLPLHTPNDEVSVAALDMNALESMGYLKIDLLGINALEKIEEVKNMVKKTRGLDINIDEIEENDKKTFELISSGETYGIFQLETNLFRKYLPRLKVSNHDELAAALALIRPGPIKGMVIDQYVMRKGGAKFSYSLPRMKDILEDTYGLMIYQEQIMMIATSIFGYSFSEADVLRDIMSKKRVERMYDEKVVFMKRAAKKKIDEKTAIEVFSLISKFGEYGFNKAHSVAYSRIAYIMAYLMANFTLEYMTALLNSDIKNSGPEFNMKINFLRKRKIPVNPIDVNHSDLFYAIEKIGDASGIRTGFLVVPGLSSVSVTEIVSERNKNGPYLGIVDFAQRLVSVSSRLKINEIEALVAAGAFAGISEGRTKERMISDIRDMIFNKRRVNKFEKNEAAGQTSFLNPPGESAAESQASMFIPSESQSQAFEQLNFQKDIFKHLIVSPVKSFSAGARDADRGESSVYGQIVDFNPAVMEMTLSDPYEPSASILKIYVPEKLAAKVAKLSKGDVVFVDYSAEDDKFPIGENNSGTASNKILVADDIISYREAKLDFKVYIKINEPDVDPAVFPRIKHLTDLHAGELPLFIKSGSFLIATNKKVDFSEKFIRDINSIDKIAGKVEIYIHYK